MVEEAKLQRDAAELADDGGDGVPDDDDLIEAPRRRRQPVEDEDTYATTPDEAMALIAEAGGEIG